MVKFKLHVLMAQKGPGRPYRITEIAELSGLQPNTVSGIYNNKARRVDLDTIDALCRVLQCSPGDLFENVPDRGKAIMAAEKNRAMMA